MWGWRGRTRILGGLGGEDLDFEEKFFIGEVFERKGGQRARISRCADGEAGCFAVAAW
jgi:hypothetical protein